MRESWRWFGPADPVPLEHVRQTGATDVVSALHDIPIGDVWPITSVRDYKRLIEGRLDTPTGLRWSVIESIPVHESIKLGEPERDVYIQNWIQSLKHAAACGIDTICYNFMPVIDWTRTDLAHRLPNGALALRYDHTEIAAFDLFILHRQNAARDYSATERIKAEKLFKSLTDRERRSLTRNIVSGLPGRMTLSHDIDGFRQAIARYQGLDKTTMRNNLSYFLDRVLPAAEESGVKLAVHPDDPPWDLFGLPRIICTSADLHWLFQRHPSRSNGMTLCVGTFGSRADNDVPYLARTFRERIFFAHLRGVWRDSQVPGSFTEAHHLDSDIDMLAVIELLVDEDRRRQSITSNKLAGIPFRPDHGHQIFDDTAKTTNPGYSALGRLKGLAEIRGAIRAIQYQVKDTSQA